jgi:uncharacterized protein YdaU (DUF1376 family)
MSDNAWYAFYVGDYARDTAHLSLLEHGAYRLLLDHYYATGHPLPNDLSKLYRICRARSPAERKAVSLVASEFFFEDGTLLRHVKCDSVLANRLKFRERQSANARIRHSRGTATAPAKTMPTTTTTTEEDDAKKSAYQRVHEAGSQLFSQLAPMNASVIHAWLNAGCSVELDILPELRRCIGRNIGGWNYFTKSIMNAKATRETPLPKGTPHAPPVNGHRYGPRISKSEQFKQAIRDCTPGFASADDRSARAEEALEPAGPVL